MNITGSGACNPEDILVIRSGYYRILIRPSGKGAVAIMDLTKLPRQYSTTSIARGFFYMCSLYARDLNNGHVFINVEYGNAIPNPHTIENQILYATVLPLRLQECRSFIVQASFVPGRELLLDFSMFKGQKIWNHVLKEAGHSINSVGGSSVRETYRKLQDDIGGLEAECLPLCVGGTYDFDLHHEWYRQRMQIEFSQIHLPTSTIHDKLHYGLGVPQNMYDNNHVKFFHGTSSLVVERKRIVPQKDRQHPTRNVLHCNWVDHRQSEKPNQLLLQWVDHRQPENYNKLEPKYL